MRLRVVFSLSLMLRCILALAVTACVQPRADDVREPDSVFARDVPTREISDAHAERSTETTSTKIPVTDIPTASIIDMWRPIPFTNVTVFSTFEKVAETRTSRLYLRIYGEDNDFAFYEIGGDFDRWDVREASPERIVVFLDGSESLNQLGKARSIIVTFGDNSGHSHHGFYPTPEAVTVSLAL